MATDDEKMIEEEKQEESLVQTEEVTSGVEVAEGNDDNDKLPNGDEIEDGENEDGKKKKTIMKVPADAPWKDRMWEVFTTFWPLGFVAFGGPQAHVAILRDHLVVQRDWLDEEQFTELFAIGQGLPGPTSTQLVISTALARAGPLGGLMAFILWNFPGMIVLTVCGVLLDTFVADPENPPFWLIGLGPAAISLVFKAFYGFAVKLDALGVCLALFSCLAAILLDNDENISSSSSQWVFPTCLIIGAIVTFIDSKRKNPWSDYGSPGKGWDSESDETMKRIGIPMWVGALIIVVWAAVMGVTTALTRRGTVNNVYLEIFSIMYRIGSIIFGGGQVVLPMLQEEVVPSWMTNEQFLQGLGLAQSMPGPLFNFSAYLGAVYKGVPGALMAFIGLFGPGVILIFGIVPFWARLRHNQNFKALLKGLNSTAIGLVGAACVILWESAIRTSADAMVFSFAITLAVYFGVMAPLVVLGGGVLGAIFSEEALNLGQQPYCVAAGYAPL
ncbi:chromate transporter [Nitzschia inconspicua]|uniref:Chromate transporter n=1 Tax=Nitzschia inconspicua TaxID=303405 RepID=A0A9K3KYS8_9STRA|nr:chromate transporter [Nitzschia inconspicua]